MLSTARTAACRTRGNGAFSTQRRKGLCTPGTPQTKSPRPRARSRAQVSGGWPRGCARGVWGEPMKGGGCKGALYGACALGSWDMDRDGNVPLFPIHHCSNWRMGDRKDPKITARMSPSRPLSGVCRAQPTMPKKYKENFFALDAPSPTRAQAVLSRAALAAAHRVLVASRRQTGAA